MVYAGIMAAGLGVRMQRQDIPKQFLLLGEKPIIVHTLEQFYIHPRIDKIIVVVPETWKRYTEDLTAKYDRMGKDVLMISGGRNKAESIHMAAQYIENAWGIDEGDILLAHDAIRPFVTQRIIDDNIDFALAHGAANTAMITNDTVIISEDGLVLLDIPDKSVMYAEQTPQTYMLTNLMDAIEAAVRNGVELHEETELSRLYIRHGHEMHLVRGEYFNMKIINPYDLEVANALLKERGL